MQHDRAKTVALLDAAGMMPVVREVAKRFGDHGRLTSIAVITPNGSAYVGNKPKKTKRVAALEVTVK
ncbi:hypothetical protein [Enterovibrio sp. 27052020O]|uniref:hypothetical protein n=1 Tax=Enterovibrio sp. 27052020O TaxID=3241166 RepID=UPI00388D0998